MAATGATHLAVSALFSINKTGTSWRSPLPRLAVRRTSSVSSTSTTASQTLAEVKDITVTDYLEEAEAFTRAPADCGPPRWFSPLECGGERLNNAPSLLYLPGIDGLGFGLTRHHKRLATMYEVWCLHIPVADRTSFTELVKLVEKTIRAENKKSPRKPIYLVGESLGACLAMVVAARNPHFDIVLILANPATSFNKSQLQRLATLLAAIPTDNLISVPYLLNIIAESRLMEPEAFGNLSRNLVSSSANYSVIAKVLPKETLMWKIDLLKIAASYANSRLHVITAQTLILTSGKDPLLPSEEEGQRLRNLLPCCEVRQFSDKGHFMFLEDGVDIVATIKAAAFYRRRRNLDLVGDYTLPNSSEFCKTCEQFRLIDVAASPVMYSTLEDGQIVRGLSGIPTEGPVIYVGYHMLLGMDLYPFITRIYAEKNILVRGLAHPMMFTKPGEFKDLDTSIFDTFRLMGAVPVSGTNMFKVLSSKSHLLLYPGGLREALHRKGEEYQLFWPEQSEFVRMASRFGAKIVPFGVVGEDDVSQLVFDYNDYMSIPYFKKLIEDTTNRITKLRMDMTGELANQPLHIPGIIPKPPGRMYYLIGKPIDTKEMKDELKDREKAQELYLHVKSEVETCLEYLKANRKRDPYRSLLSRALYLATNGFTSEIPAFDP